MAEQQGVIRGLGLVGEGWWQASCEARVSSCSAVVRWWCGELMVALEVRQRRKTPCRVAAAGARAGMLGLVESECG